MPKISQLPILTNINTGSVIPIVDNSRTQRISVGKLYEFLSGALDETFATEVELLRSASGITSSFEAFTSSVDARLDVLETPSLSISASQITALGFATTGSNTFTQSQTISAGNSLLVNRIENTTGGNIEIAASGLLSLSGDGGGVKTNDNFEANPGGNATFKVISGSVIVTGSIRATGTPIISSSTQITALGFISESITDTGSLLLTSSFNTFSSSVHQRIIDATNEQVIDGFLSTSSFNSFTSSLSGVYSSSAQINGNIYSAGSSFTFQDLLLGAGTTFGKITTDGSKYISVMPTYNVESARFWANGNVTIQDAGTYVDNGYRLEVSGSSRIVGDTIITGSLIVSGGFEVKNNGYSWSFNSDGNTILPTVLTGDTSIGTTFNTNPPGHTLTIKHNGGVSGGSGGELQFDYGNAKIKVVKDAGTTHTWSFNSDGTTRFPNDTINAGTNEIYIQSSNNASLLYGALDGNWQSEPAQNQLAGINVGYDGVTIQQMRGNDGEGGPQWAHEWAFNKDGTTTFPNDIIDGGLNKVEIKSSNYVEMHYAEEDGVWQNFTATNKEAWVFVDPDGAAIQVLRGDDGNNGPVWNHTWRFNKDGAIALPGGGKISEGGVNNNAIKLTPANGANENQALLIYPTAGAPEGNHIHLTANGGTTELYLGDDNHFVKLANSGNVDIRAYQPDSPYNSATWTFGIDGAISTTDNLILNIPNGVPNGVTSWIGQGGWNQGFYSAVTASGGTGTGLTVDVAAGGAGYINIEAISINNPGSGYTNGDVVTINNENNLPGTFIIVVTGTNSWEFDINGDLIFPDSTIQTTAFIPTTLVTTSSFNTFTSSVNTFSASVNGKTGSFATTGSNIFTGDQTITGSLAINDSATNFLIEGNGFSQTYLTSNGAIVLNPGYGGVEMVGSYRELRLTDIYAEGFISASTITGLGNATIYSQSVDSRITAIVTGTGSLVTTSSFNTFTSSVNTFTSSVIATGSLINTFTSSINSFSASVRASGSIINTFTASVNTTTASLNSKTGSYATTGSNQFNGNQSITGSLNVSSIAVVSSSFTANSSSLTLNSGSNLFIQNNGLVEISGSLTVSGSQTISGSLTIRSGSITMPDRPAFRIIGTGGATAAQTILSGSRISVDYNQGNHFNTTTGLFTAPIAGLYQVNLVMRTNSNTNSTINQAIVYKSGSGGDEAQIMIEYGVNTTMNHTGGSTISRLAVGDTLRTIIAVGTCSFDQNDNFSVAYIG
jgi:hypothetical protein